MTKTSALLFRLPGAQGEVQHVPGGVRHGARRCSVQFCRSKLLKSPMVEGGRFLESSEGGSQICTRRQQIWAGKFKALRMASSQARASARRPHVNPPSPRAGGFIWQGIGGLSARPSPLERVHPLLRNPFRHVPERGPHRPAEGVVRQGVPGVLLFLACLASVRLALRPCP